MRHHRSVGYVIRTERDRLGSGFVDDSGKGIGKESDHSVTNAEAGIDESAFELFVFQKFGDVEFDAFGGLAVESRDRLTVLR
ncbi:MAG: hypothetical protein M2R45_00522 [Verrucomicrobia subdivision 3 bacterium]|nr:hypothetical protein [Limisphaerales bacterium]MCS1413600.1 hypothetical protein [Limisphaerales bacterium]